MGIALLPEFLVQSDLAEERLIRVLPEVRGGRGTFISYTNIKVKNQYTLLVFISLYCHYFAKASR